MSLVTYQGILFNYLEPTEDMININDIVYSLSRMNRFVGHSKRAYSVAEHSYLCYKVAKELGYTNREQMLVLLHDFTEAYVGDCPSPLKILLPEFSQIESKVEQAIYKHFRIAPPTPEECTKIKLIDITMLAIEMRDLTNHDYTAFIGGCAKDILEDKDFYISTAYMPEHRARNMVLDAYNSLMTSGATFYDKYQLRYGVKGGTVHIAEECHLDYWDAMQSAKQYAKDFYCLNEQYDDVYDIMKNERVDERTAHLLFDYKMNDMLRYEVEKIEEV